MISSQWLININENSWQQSKFSVLDLFNFDSEFISVLQKYSNIKLNKQLIMNTLNSNKKFLQSDSSTTEADLFEIYININFPSFNINMSTSRLSSVLETIKISELE